MITRRVQLFSLVALLLSAFSIAGFASFGTTAQETVKPLNFARDASLKGLVNYRQWTRVNDKAISVVAAPADPSSPDLALAEAG